MNKYTPRLILVFLIGCIALPFGVAYAMLEALAQFVKNGELP